jgi:hypothetical protein
MGLNMTLPEISEDAVQIVEKLVRLGAIYAIASMEYQLIVTGQDGTLLLPVAFIIGLIAGLKVSDIKDCIIKR